MDTTFSAIIQNNLNEIMKVLTSLTIIITIPMIVAGIWGMNIPLPFMEHPLSLAILMAVTVLLMIATARVLKHKDLL